MPRTLTSDDLDAIGADAFQAEDPMALVAELVDAVDHDRLADPHDVGYALGLAAEITERTGDLPHAVRLNARAVHDADERGGAPGWLRAFHGERLIRLGRVGDGVSELSALRPLLTRDIDAVSYLVDALTAADRSELALQWLDAAVVTALERREKLATDDGSEEYGDAATIAYGLVQRRHHLRRDRGLPHDEHDRLADQLADAVDEALENDDEEEAPDALFWPRPQFDELLSRRPDLADELGATWDDQRAKIERDLRSTAEPRSEWVIGIGTDALVALVAGDLPDERPDEPLPLPTVTWPPGRNAPCWCGSGHKYKKCCLPRGRG